MILSMLLHYILLYVIVKCYYTLIQFVIDPPISEAAAGFLTTGKTDGISVEEK